jgi:hypothetical protein
LLVDATIVLATEDKMWGSLTTRVFGLGEDCVEEWWQLENVKRSVCWIDAWKGTGHLVKFEILVTLADSSLV